MYFLNDIGGNTALSPSLPLLVLFSPTFVNDKITVVYIRETASKRDNVFLFPIDRHSLSLSVSSLRNETIFVRDIFNVRDDGVSRKFHRNFLCCIGINWTGNSEGAASTRVRCDVAYKLLGT